MILLTFDIPFVFYDADVMPIINVSNVIAEANHDVWCDDKRRRNTDAPIDDPNIASVDRSENVDESTTGSALTQISWTVPMIYKWIILLI